MGNTANINMSIRQWQKPTLGTNKHWFCFVEYCHKNPNKNKPLTCNKPPCPKLIMIEEK